MIRVGFMLGDTPAGWTGGKHYYRSLLSSLELIENRRLHPVLFVAPSELKSVSQQYPYAECISCSYFEARSTSSIVWRVSKRLLGVRTPLVAPLLRKYRIDVLSHFGPVPAWTKVKTIGWIPDFQHVHLPQFFSPDEQAARDASFKTIIRRCDRIVVSSKAALGDLDKFAPESSSKVRVLSFVPEVMFPDRLPTAAELRGKYNIAGPYFHVPNQFWAHKNHKVVVEALTHMKKKGVEGCVIATGQGHDYRNPGFFNELTSAIRDRGLSTAFRALGVIPYSDLLGLMHHSLAVINPSLFEGWSTTVEEAKALGKKVLLSDIAVHREQCPIRAVFFPPHDAVALATAMLDVLQCAKPHASESPAELVLQHDRLRRSFAQQYQDIVVEAAAQ